LGFESQLWAAANALRGSMDAEYKHVVLGLISLKYISDVFEEHYGYFLATMDGGMKHAHSGLPIAHVASP
jgi:type I restriction enzyme M protein